MWLFVVGSQAIRLGRSGALDEAEREYDGIREVLEASKSESAKERLGVVYHQLGNVAYQRGDLSAAEGWYGKSLEIKEALGDRPGMAQTYHQFGYVAYVDGLMVRQKPATNLFLGTFEAESLILAETGNSIGAVQIAGTDSTIQLAFFIVACDYTLIGEELFAASGYLTKDPMVLGSIKAQDWLKIFIIILIILGGVFTSLNLDFFANLFSIG